MGSMKPITHFILSPAHSGGRRAATLARPEADFDLAVRFRSEGAEIGEVFSFLSGLYFRGKMAYVDRFGSPASGLPAGWVITSSRGLLAPDTRIGPDDLREFAGARIDRREPAYTEPLARTASRIFRDVPADARVVLLGSIATAKYVEELLQHLGERLLVPEPFIGMGDMQRGALMLRAAAAGEELPYIPALDAIVRRNTGRPVRPAPDPR